jgi:hypothetical protein
MQYTASSFSDPVTTLFKSLLQTHKKIVSPDGYFPEHAEIETRTGDVFLRRVFTPVFMATAWVAEKIHDIRQGHNQLYILYIVLTLMVLLLWTFRG